MNRRPPSQIERNKESGIKLSWADGTRAELSSQTLRSACPCAGCREERGDSSHSAPLTSPPKSIKSSLTIVEHTKEESLFLEEIIPIGNYAIKLRWKDGHQDGIYSFDLLNELSTQ